MTECATLTDLLRFAPEFGSVGTKSFGTIEFSASPNPGDVFKVEDPYSIPPSSLGLVAGTDFVIDVDPLVTAVNFAAALSGIVTGTASGSTVTVVSSSSGAATLYTWTSDFGVLEPSTILGPTDGPVLRSLELACKMVDPACYKTKTKEATILLAGHFLELLGHGQGSKGSLQKRKIDKLEVQYFTTGVPGDKDLGQTRFGRMLIQLKKTIFTPPLVGRTGGFGVGFVC